MAEEKKSIFPFWAAGLAAWGIHSIVESVTVDLRHQLVTASLESTFNEAQYSILYHWGDFNNAFLYAGALDLILNKVGVENSTDEVKKYVAFSSAIVCAALFTIIEWEDKWDLPAAYLGAWTYAATRISALNSHRNLLLFQVPI